MTTNTPTERPQAHTHPIENILPLLKKVRSLQSGRGFTACCPAHNDGSPSLSVWEDGQRVGLCCFAGCSQEAILSAIGLTWRDLYPAGKMPPAPTGGITIYDLAQDKLINPHFFDKWGITDTTFAGQRAVRIPYYTEDGAVYERIRFRTSLVAKAGSKWDTKSDAPLIPYGLNRLEEARKAGYLIIVEGESDCWTLWQRGIPALGLPGAKMASALKASHLAGIERVFLSQEDDQAGQKFPGEVYAALKKQGHQGKVYVIEWAAFGANDPNDLHKKDVKGFKATIEQALTRALPMHKERKKPTVARLCDLQQESLPETRWAIDPILPEGVTILSGPPKMGKSWLALALLESIASGGAALGQYPVERGEVLYLALEDNKKRLQKRTNTFLDRAQASPDFFYALEWPRVDDGGVEELAEWIDEHPRVRLICIDTIKAFKSKPKGRGQNQQDEDYEEIRPLQQLAGKKGVSIVIIEHSRELASDDPLNMINGTAGKTGGVDNFLVLFRKRGETDARLFVGGRDIEEEQTLLLRFNQQCASWVVKGDANDTTIGSTPERQAILDVLVLNSQGLTCKALANTLQKNINTTRNLLASLRQEEKVTLKNDTYSIVTHSKPSKDSNPSNPSNPPENEPGKVVTRPTTGVTRPYYGNSSTLVTPQHDGNEPIEPDHDGDLPGVTRVTRDTMENQKKRIRAYGEARGFPRLALANDTTIPAGEVGWNGFLEYRSHLWQQAYDDICAGKVRAM